MSPAAPVQLTVFGILIVNGPLVGPAVKPGAGVQKVENAAGLQNRLPCSLYCGTVATGPPSSAYRYSPITCKPVIGVCHVAIGSIAQRWVLPRSTCSGP